MATPVVAERDAPQTDAAESGSEASGSDGARPDDDGSDAAPARPSDLPPLPGTCIVLTNYNLMAFQKHRSLESGNKNTLKENQ